MKTNEKQQILTALSEIFILWQTLLTSLPEEQITTPLLPSDWTVKDIVAHMWAWQQASVARAVGALHDVEPNYPQWWHINGPNPEDDVDRTNAWIFNAYRERPWLSVYADWKEQFQFFLELTRQVPEKDLLEPGKYAWMSGYALIASVMGSLDHHQEHYETLTAWLHEHRNPKAD